MDSKQLALVAAKARVLGLDMVYRANSGSIGDSFSAVDALTTLYFHIMDIDPANPSDPDQDRFFLSKGHCTPALYPVLALRGFLPVEELDTLRSIDGQGISAAVSMALAGKTGKKSYRVYTLLGERELDEGQVRETCITAARLGLDNLCAIVDVNGLPTGGRTCDIIPTEPLDKKFASFGWNVIKADGHDYSDLIAALEEARTVEFTPSVILAKTVRGKGVSFMENDPNRRDRVNAEQYAQARAELETRVAELESR